MGGTQPLLNSPQVQGVRSLCSVGVPRGWQLLRGVGLGYLHSSWHHHGTSSSRRERLLQGPTQRRETLLSPSLPEDPIPFSRLIRPRELCFQTARRSFVLGARPRLSSFWRCQRWPVIGARRTMSRSRYPKGSACAAPAGAAGPGRCPNTGTVPHCCMSRGLTDGHSDRVLCSAVGTELPSQSQAGQGCLSLLCCARSCPGTAAATRGFRLVKAGRSEPQTPHSSPLPGGEDRAMPCRATPGEAALPPAQQQGSLRTPLGSPRSTGAELCPPRPAPPRLRRSRRDTEEFRGGRAVPGWALRDGRVSSLRGQAGQAARSATGAPSAPAALRLCPRPSLGRAGWASPLPPPCSESAASRSRSDPGGAQPGPSRGSLVICLRVGTVVLPHRLKIPPGGRVGQRREVRSVCPAWLSGCGWVQVSQPRGCPEIGSLTCCAWG